MPLSDTVPLWDTVPPWDTVHVAKGRCRRRPTLRRMSVVRVDIPEHPLYAYACHRRAGSSDEYSPEFPGQFPANIRKLSESSVTFRTCRAPRLVSHRRAFHAPINVRVQLEEGVVGGRPLPVAGGLHPQDREDDVPVVEQVLHAWVRSAVHLSRYALRGPKGRSSCVCTLGDPGGSRKLPGVLNVQHPVTESSQKNREFSKERVLSCGRQSWSLPRDVI